MTALAARCLILAGLLDYSLGNRFTNTPTTLLGVGCRAALANA